MNAVEERPDVVPSTVLAAEQRRNRPAGIAAMVAVLASFAALVVLVGSTEAGSRSTVSARALRDADQHASTLWAAVGLRSLSLVAIAIVGAHLVWLIGHREVVPRTMRVLAVAAPLAIAAAVIASNIALIDSAHSFVSHGLQTEARAKHLLRDGAGQRITSVATIATALAFSVWLGWASLAGSRVGLMTKFLGYFGAGGAIASVIIPVAGQGLVIGWLGSVAVLLLGWWPGGRGPAWTTGEIGPWISEPPGRARRQAGG